MRHLAASAVWLATILSATSHAFTISIEHHHHRRQPASVSLYASSSNNKQSSSMPANLKRKVNAKRDPLGHVVPERTRTKGGKQYYEYVPKYVHPGNIVKLTTESSQSSLQYLHEFYSWRFRESTLATTGESARSRIE
jgi:hypothetical protein